MAEKTKLNLYEKLAKIRSAVEVVQTDKAGFGYRYVTDEALFAKITGVMTKYAVSLVPAVVPGTLVMEQYRYDKIDKKTKELIPQNEILVHAEMTYTWVNNDDPSETITVPWVMTGQQADASQAFGSALTYSMRYFILKYFAVATPDDDPDDWRSKQKEAELAEDKAVAAGILSLFDTELKGWLAANPGGKDKALSFIKGFEKSGNYMNITNPRLAEKLRADFEKAFIESKEE